MEPTLESPRLRLIRMHNTDLDSQHLQWWHRLWSDDAATAWSLHGKCNTLEESQAWLVEQLTKHDNIVYAIFDKQDANGNSISHPGNLVGNIGLRIEAEPELPPFPPPNATTGPAKRLNMRQLGYAFFEAAWGKGYATEAGRAIVGAYEASVAEEKAKGEQEFYIEATWDKDNPASQKVLQKLGFSVVGWKEETERVFLAGAWRDPGIWVYGKYVE